MSHKTAKRARKMFPELGAKHRREQDRLRSEALAATVKLRDEARAELAGDSKPATERVAHIDSPRSSLSNRLKIAALLAALGASNV